jgi:hypothetical protein
LIIHPAQIIDITIGLLYLVLFHDRGLKRDFLYCRFHHGMPATAKLIKNMSLNGKFTHQQGSDSKFDLIRQSQKSDLFFSSKAGGQAIAAAGS